MSYIGADFSTKSLVNRLSDLQSGRLTPEARSLKDRFPDAVNDPLGVLSSNDWPELSDEETKQFIEASTRLAKEESQSLLEILIEGWIC